MSEIWYRSLKLLNSAHVERPHVKDNETVKSRGKKARPRTISAITKQTFEQKAAGTPHESRNKDVLLTNYVHRNNTPPCIYIYIYLLVCVLCTIVLGYKTSGSANERFGPRRKFAESCGKCEKKSQEMREKLFPFRSEFFQREFLNSQALEVEV